MEVFLDVVRSVFPAVLMLILAYLMLSSFMENEERKRKGELRRAAQNQALPVRMQAYERLTLLLERIAPNSLLVRVQPGTLTVREYHTLLTQAIRQEFEYNLSQQIYVSADAWQIITTAKNALVSIINQTASTLDPTLGISRSIQRSPCKVITAFWRNGSASVPISTRPPLT